MIQQGKEYVMAGDGLFIFGLGYVGGALALDLMSQGWRVAGTLRDAQRGLTLARQGIKVSVGDQPWNIGPLEDHLKGASHVLVTLPPIDGEDVLASGFRPGSGLRWLGYLSSTAVYGDSGGAWVDEESPPAPTFYTGRARLTTEQAWQGRASARGLPLHIFRLAGIYGPGRNVLERLRAGVAHRVDKPDHVMCRIHLGDILATLKASMVSHSPGAIYNLADDEPAAQAEVVEYAARLLGVEPPVLVPFDDPSLPAATGRFFADCRRVTNRRIKHELGVSLIYPDYKAGLAHLVRSFT